jgi:glycosyltransferase involved in cell wall biosynthesis
MTGFICETEAEMVEAIFRLGQIDRARCRAEAERRFSPAAMAAQYEQLYALLSRNLPTTTSQPAANAARVQ